MRVRLKQSPAWLITAVLTLALGVGATTAIFTLIEQVMLRSLPVSHPEQLWRVGDADRCCYAEGYSQNNERSRNDWTLFSWEAYTFFRLHAPAFQDLAAFQLGEGNAELAVRRAGSAAPVESLNGEYVSGNFFRTLGVSARQGRMFGDDDDREGAAPVAVMTFHTWQTQYGSDPSVVGSTFEINDSPFTVIGIAPAAFYGAKAAASDMPDLWLPLTTEPLIAGATSRLNNPAVGWVNLIGRARPGAQPRAIEAQLQGELHEWLASHANDMGPRDRRLWQQQTLHLTPDGAGVSLMRDTYGRSLRLLMMSASCVLMLACANIANLLLARSLRSRRQTAVRMALGASRGRLMRDALVDSVMLGVAGGAAGVAVAYAAARLILHLAFVNPDVWVPVSAAPSTPVLLFALGVSIATGVAFGMAPAWMASRIEPTDAMRGASRIAGAGGGVRTAARAQRTLIVAQTAVSLIVLSAAMLFGRSLSNLVHQDLGFDPGGRYLISIDPKLSNYRQDRLVPLFAEIRARLGAIPGVRSVSPVLYAPLSDSYWSHEIRVFGRPEPAPTANLSTAWTRVTPGFFETLGDRIVTGRPITEDDNNHARLVAVVNESFAKTFFGNSNPVGAHFGPAPRKNANLYEIVGVAANVRYFTSATERPDQPMYFVPEAQGTMFDDPNLEHREVWSHYLYSIVVWAPGGQAGLEAVMRRELADVDTNLVIDGIKPYGVVVRRTFARQNMIASLTWIFGIVGLALAGVGLYGVTAYAVEQRSSEIGVRMALGANRRSVLAMVLRGAFGPVAIGVAIGLPAALAAGQLIANQLFGVRASNPLMFSAAVLLFALTVFAAALIPAVRAAGVDPMRTLRTE
jgi:putative ABC transport system permease protein